MKHTWTIPGLIAALTLAGLLAALVAKGPGDAFGWLALAVPIALCARLFLGRTPRTAAANKADGPRF